jgi:hypothetical protein
MLKKSEISAIWAFIMLLQDTIHIWDAEIK